MIKKTDTFLVFVGSLPESAKTNILEYISEKKKNWKILVLQEKNTKLKEFGVHLDFNNEKEITSFFEQHEKQIFSVTARGEKNIPLYKKIIPFLPAHIKHPSIKSLTLSTEKTLMRKAFAKKNKKLNPKFKIIHKNNEKTIDEICTEIGFPLVIKPSGLASSMLVSAAYYREELEEGLAKTFKKINVVYKKMNGRGEPTILVEEMIEGKIYSVDAHINNTGEIFFNPFVEYTTAREKGFDDFFIYEQHTPARIGKDSLTAGKEIAKKGIEALGLRNSSAHIELIREDEKWKIIEIGPRLGGFRSEFYKQSFDINLDINDLLIHAGKKPNMKRTKQGYSSVVKFYAPTEGYLKKILGIIKAQKLDSVLSFKKNLHKGDQARFAKHGGEYVCRFMLFNTNKQQFIADKRKLEKMIHIETTKYKTQNKNR